MLFSFDQPSPCQQDLDSVELLFAMSTVLIVAQAEHRGPWTTGISERPTKTDSRELLVNDNNSHLIYLELETHWFTHWFYATNNRNSINAFYLPGWLRGHSFESRLHSLTMTRVMRSDNQLSRERSGASEGVELLQEGRGSKCHLELNPFMWFSCLQVRHGWLCF